MTNISPAPTETAPAETGSALPAPGLPAPGLTQSPILVVTRFSFLGQSGWQSDASRDAAQLFLPDRLWRRLELFSAITLPSLAAQTDPGFHHLILTSDQLPDWAMEELDDACLLVYGDRARFTILAEPPGTTRRPLRLFMQRSCPGPYVIQVVLDDDDGLAADYMAELRGRLAVYEAEVPDLPASLPHFFSYPEGYGLVLRDEADAETAAMESAELYLHRYPYINLGLALVGTPGGKNIFAIDHLAAPRRFGGHLLPGKPMFVRAVHDFNDSRVTPTERWKPFPGWRNSKTIARRFPWLLAPDAPWNKPVTKPAGGPG